jgi:hypothetical protein
MQERGCGVVAGRERGVASSGGRTVVTLVQPERSGPRPCPDLAP